MIVKTDDIHYKNIAKAIGSSDTGASLVMNGLLPSEMPDAIRSVAEGEYNTGYYFGAQDGQSEGYKRGKEEGIIEGKQAEYDRFWDMFQDSGNRVAYGSAFTYWSAEYIRPNYKVVPTQIQSFSSTFGSCKKLKKIEAEYFDFSQKPKGTASNTGYTYTFSSCAELEEIEDIGLLPQYTYRYTFAYSGKLKTISKMGVDADTLFLDAFRGCYELRNLTIEGTIAQNGFNVQWSTELSKASITSIINALSSTTSGLSVTLSQTAVDNAFAGGSTGDEWLNLIAPKNNWAIHLI